jgi:hypothetical protein
MGFPCITHEEVRTCHVVGEGCKAPPAWTKSHTKAECFACGNTVCTSSKCSTRRNWYTYGKRRVCASCAEERKKDNA